LRCSVCVVQAEGHLRTHGDEGYHRERQPDGARKPRPEGRYGNECVHGDFARDSQCTNHRNPRPNRERLQCRGCRSPRTLLSPAQGQKTVRLAVSWVRSARSNPARGEHRTHALLLPRRVRGRSTMWPQVAII